MRGRRLDDHPYNRPMKPPLLVTIAVGGLLVAACNGGDEPVVTTTPAPAATATTTAAVTAPPTTTATTTTTSTVAPTTTPTTPPSTPPAPPTTPIDPATPTSFTAIGDISAEERGAIETAFREAFRTFEQALLTPDDEAAVQLAYSYASGTNLEAITAQVEQFRADNQRLRPSDQFEPSRTILQGPGRLSDAPDEVVLIVCDFDPWEVVEVGTGPDGSDKLVNDAVSTRRAEVYMRIEDGRWKIYRYRLDRRWEGVTECRD